MTSKDQIQQDLKEAMKSGDTRRREALRLLMAAFKQVEVDKRIELSADDVLGILMVEAKKRRESVDEMTRAGRTDLADQEQYELTLIEAYLPQQLSRDKVEEMVRAAILEVGATTPKDMGKIMQVLMPRLKGQADGKLVNTIVRELLV
ncbi:MAG: GatB/YqeY domain-containing protein [Chloroflexi bacterium]|nr:GatB/YqeY domain-containing protein [Chloroflexota bacterium]